VIAHDLLAAGDFTMVRAELVRALGGDANAALVLTRIHWRLEREPGDRWRGSFAQIADETGLSPTQVKRTVAKLRDAGHLETIEEHMDGAWDHTLSYRVILSDSSQGPIPPDRKTKSSDDRTESPNLDGTESSLLPLPKTERKTKNYPSDVAGATIFGEFWDVYPRKVGKREAERKFQIAARTVDVAVILDGARRYATARRGQPVEYTKHPATWLHQGCWDDAPVANGRVEDKDPDWAPWL
jgi:hypothetical protein